MSGPAKPANEKLLTVSELNRAVKLLVEEAYPNVWLVGEVSKFKRHTSGHWYFTLKDDRARIGAVMLRGFNLRVKFDPHDGMKLLARGQVSIYEPNGEYQLYVQEVRPEGIGPLELAFRQLKERLSVKGYFQPRRKKPLPRFPRRLVLVTSPTGDAVRDMLETIGRRWPAVEVWVCPVPVQGEGAAQKIADAIRMLNQLRGIDVLVLGRGGGSLEDLWAFNEEVLADALFASRIPVVCGVGHETDLTIADMVADVRAETPTAAAVRVVPDRREVWEQLQTTQARLTDLLRRRFHWAREQLLTLAGRRPFQRPLERVQDLERRLDETAVRLGRAARQRLCQSHQRLEAVAGRLESLSPLNVLARGYSLTRKETDQTVVRAADQVRPGDRLVTLVQAGRIVSRVEEASAASLSQG